MIDVAPLQAARQFLDSGIQRMHLRSRNIARSGHGKGVQGVLTKVRIFKQRL